MKCCTWPSTQPINGAAAVACDLDQVNNCLQFGGTVAACYNNTGCSIPTLAADIQFSATTDDWSEDGMIAHANITESDDPELSAAVRASRTTSGGVITILAVAMTVIAVAVSTGAVGSA